MTSAVESWRLEINPIVAEWNEIEKRKSSKVSWKLFDMWEYQVSDARNEINSTSSEAFLIISIFKMTPRWKTVVLVAEKHEFENRYESIIKATFGSFGSSRFCWKEIKKRFFNQIFLPKWNASSQILMGESSQVSLSNKVLITDITQNYRHFLESLDYQDFHSRIPQKDFLMDCSSRSVYFFIVILSLEITPVVAEENELEQWSNPSLLGFFRFLRLPEFWW